MVPNIVGEPETRARGRVKVHAGKGIGAYARCRRQSAGVASFSKHNRSWKRWFSWPETGTRGEAAYGGAGGAADVAELADETLALDIGRALAPAVGRGPGTGFQLSNAAFVTLQEDESQRTRCGCRVEGPGAGVAGLLGEGRTQDGRGNLIPPSSTGIGSLTHHVLETKLFDS